MMKKVVELERLERMYYKYHVERDPDSNGFLVQNLHDPNLPQGLTLWLPPTMDVAMDGDYLDPARFIPDRFETLAGELGLPEGFGGISTRLMFCHFDENLESGRKLITPADPRCATHVIVRVAWDLTKDVHIQGTRSVDPEDYVKVVWEWHDTDLVLSRGWDVLIIELGDKLSEEFRRELSYDLDDIAHRHDIAAQIFEQEKGDYRALFEQLETRSDAVGWKMNFGKPDADAVKVTYSNERGIHTCEYRYCKVFLDLYVSALVEQEAWCALLSKPREQK